MDRGILAQPPAAFKVWGLIFAVDQRAPRKSNRAQGAAIFIATFKSYVKSRVQLPLSFLSPEKPSQGRCPRLHSPAWGGGLPHKTPSPPPSPSRPSQANRGGAGRRRGRKACCTQSYGHTRANLTGPTPSCAAKATLGAPRGRCTPRELPRLPSRPPPRVLFPPRPAPTEGPLPTRPRRPHAPVA